MSGSNETGDGQIEFCGGTDQFKACDNHIVARLIALSILSRDLLTAHRGSTRHNEVLPRHRDEWQPLVRVLTHGKATLLTPIVPRAQQTDSIQQVARLSI